MFQSFLNLWVPTICVLPRRGPIYSVLIWSLEFNGLSDGLGDQSPFLDNQVQGTLKSHGKLATAIFLLQHASIVRY